MTTIQTLVYDLDQKQWLEGDAVTNLHTHPDTHLTEGVSVFLAQPSRYKVCRWSGETTTGGYKIFIGDILIEPSQDQSLPNPLWVVKEQGSRVYVVRLEPDAPKTEYMLAYVITSQPLLHSHLNIRTHGVLDQLKSPPVPE